MKPPSLVRSIALIILFVASTGIVRAQDVPLKSIDLVFQNSTDGPVTIFWVKISEGQSDQEILYFESLPAGMQQEQSSFVGQVWRIKKGTQQIAEFTAQDALRQEVDIAELMEWQREIELVFQNTTQNPLDIVWVDESGDETTYVQQLPPGKEAVQKAFAGQLWRIRDAGDHKLVADYIPDNLEQQYIDLSVLIADYLPPVTVVFQNTTDKMVDVTWVNLDDDEIVYADSLPTGMQHKQTAYPYQLWRIRHGETLIAEYSPDETPVQTVDIKALVASLQNPSTTSGGSTDATRQPPKPPRPGGGN